ncbi:hypothetical protein HPB48_004402 [Haemaphysalis longicornis]|uniref:Uncharacterized protein n=1 Tax=Haemaphysalis longicornis TaxID=44386 RepID=A0A9J6G1Q5_HAELO|nr:hypothetical protein HPB48_004402 [Haemaphysalis longicornis]
MPSVEEEREEDKGTPSEDGLLYLRNGSPEPSILLPDSVVSKTTGELLLRTPDSSLAGRQSPAPSEVSKTESALSPPSEASKTESARQPPLSKIEEAAQEALKRAAVPVLEAAKVPQEASSTQETQQPLVPRWQQQQWWRQALCKTAKKMSLAARKNKKSSKPWYEVSDEEDMLLPDKYQTVRARNSSEDEADLAIVA